MAKTIRLTVFIFILLFTLATPVVGKVIGGPDYDAQRGSESLSRSETAGDRQFESGFYEQAIKTWRTPYQVFRDNQDIAGQVRLLYKIATAQRQMGLHDRAVQGLAVAQKLLSLTNDLEMKLLVSANLAGAYLYSDDIKNAKRELVDARNTAKKAKNDEVLALITNDLGNLYLQTKQNEKALAAFSESYDIGTKLNDSSLQLRASTNSLLLLIQQGKQQQAGESLKKAMSVLYQFKPSYQKSYGLIKVADAGLQYMTEFDSADVALLTDLITLTNQELAFTRSLNNDWLIAQHYMVLSGFYEAANRYEDALSLANRALFHAQSIEDSLLIYKLQWQSARIYRAMNQHDKAIDSYQTAVNTLNPIRHQLTSNSWHSSAFENRDGNLYLELADLMLTKARQSNDQQLISSLLKDTRGVLESQKTAEVQDYFKDQCAIEAQALKVNIDEAINETTAVIYPILLEDRTELLVSTTSGIKQYVVSKTEKDVTEQVRKLRLKLEKRRSKDYLPFAQSLYETLVAPIEPDLQSSKIKTLVFIPGQSLRTIPVTVLHDGKQFLIDKYAIATTPGLTLTDPRPLKRERLKVLLSGLSQPVQGYPPLEFVQNELHSIEDLYTSTTLLDNSFVKTKVSSELQNSGYGVAHFASHAEFTGDVRNSYILTYDDRLTVSQLGQLASLNQYRKKPIELLTLSACNTAAGDDRAALGLAGVAVQSGARSALASLWSINDKASSMLVAEFYRQLLDENVTKAEALRRAQQKMMQNVRYRHPGYWSPFLLIGNWL